MSLERELPSISRYLISKLLEINKIQTSIPFESINDFSSSLYTEALIPLSALHVKRKCLISSIPLLHNLHIPLLSLFHLLTLYSNGRVLDLNLNLREAPWKSTLSSRYVSKPGVGAGLNTIVSEWGFGIYINITFSIEVII